MRVVATVAALSLATGLSACVSTYTAPVQGFTTDQQVGRCVRKAGAYVDGRNQSQLMIRDKNTQTGDAKETYVDTRGKKYSFATRNKTVDTRTDDRFKAENRFSDGNRDIDVNKTASKGDKETRSSGLAVYGNLDRDKGDFGICHEEGVQP